MAINGDYTKDLMSALNEAGIDMDNPAQDAPKPAKAVTKPAGRKPKKTDDTTVPDAPKPVKRRGRPPKNVSPAVETVDVRYQPKPDAPPSAPEQEPVKPEEDAVPAVPDFGRLFGTISIEPESEPAAVPEPVKGQDKEAIYAKMRGIQDSLSAYRDATQKFITASDTAISALQDELVALEAMLHNG